MENPFNPTRVAAAADFVNRDDELATLSGCLRDHVNVLLVGPRRLGKSSLVREAFRRLGHEALCLYVDVTRSIDDADVAMAILNELSRAAGRARRVLDWIITQARALRARLVVGADGPRIELEPGARPARPLPDVLQLLEAYGERHDTTVILALDEFQTVMHRDSDTIAAMRSVIQHQRRTSYIFSGSERTTMLALTRDRRAPFWKQLREVHVEGVAIDHFRPLLDRHFESFDDAAVEVLRDACGDNTMRIVEALHQLHDQTRHVDPEAALTAVAALVDANRPAFERDLSLVKEGNQKRVLMALAREPPEHVTGKHYMQRHGLDTPSNVRRALQRLRDLELVDEENRVMDPLFAVYLRGDIRHA